MDWKKADPLTIIPDRNYLVKTNADEWRDFPYVIMKGIAVVKKMEPNYVRGRPLWVCEITPPEEK